ncbi:MAG: type II toxin-antitoxin system Phd/YefM family antitoxin [Elusimicrobiota bacterium]|jgi:PHD/YefM family antitoxin component YafN of YafNO toxin-antitoxin module|nr:type II toxin-antitoxin system Phd/YefM family antitoxin [Elusimicrobiota bacterium]
MTIIGATQLRNNLFKTLDTCIKYNEPITINTKKGNLVLMTDEEYRGWKETLYLCSIPGMKESLIKAKHTPLSKCRKVKVNEL